MPVGGGVMVTHAYMKEVRDALDPTRPITMADLSRKLDRLDSSLAVVLKALNELGAAEQVDLPEDYPGLARKGWVKRGL